MPRSLPSPRRAAMLLILTTFFWGITFTIVKDAVSRVDMFVFLAQRFTLASVTMILPGVVLKGAPDRGAVKAGAILGIFLFAAYGFQTAALLFTSASNTAFLTGLNVVMVPLFGGLLLRQRISGRVMVSATVATIGLFLLTTGGTLSVNRGDILGLVCAICVALHILLTDRFAPHHDVYWVTAIQLTTIAILSSLCALGQGEPVVVWYPFLLWPLIICALFATVFAFLVQTSMQRFISPVQTALIFCLEPVFAALYAYLMADERLSPTGWTGAILILAAMLSAEGTKREAPS